MMGGIASFRPSPAGPGRTESRTGWLGVAIWIALVVIRVGLDVVGRRTGGSAVTPRGREIDGACGQLAASEVTVADPADRLRARRRDLVDLLALFLVRGSREAVPTYPDPGGRTPPGFGHRALVHRRRYDQRDTHGAQLPWE